MDETRPAFRRGSGCAFRWFRGDVLILPSDGKRVRITGAAALAWMELEELTDVATLTGRIEDTWPHLGPADEATTHQALQTLLDRGLVERV